MLDEQLLTKKELAAFIHQTPRAVENLMRRGLPHLKLSSRATRFRLQDVQTYLDERCKVVRTGSSKQPETQRVQEERKFMSHEKRPSGEDGPSIGRTEGDQREADHAPPLSQLASGCEAASLSDQAEGTIRKCGLNL